MALLSRAVAALLSLTFSRKSLAVRAFSSGSSAGILSGIVGARNTFGPAHEHVSGSIAGGNTFGVNCGESFGSSLSLLANTRGGSLGAPFSRKVHQFSVSDVAAPTDSMDEVKAAAAKATAGEKLAAMRAKMAECGVDGEFVWATCRKALTR